jgi:proteasome lid subunit RPN8/RPN11
MLRIAQDALFHLRRHGEETYPHECCGVLLGQMQNGVGQGEGKNEAGIRKIVTRAVRCTNTRDDSPQNRYNIDPKELIRIQRESSERGEEIVGFYHSHPDHPAQWSQTDLAEAFWFGCSYVITSVENGNATNTNAFELTGTDESDKKFVDEPVFIG